MKTQLQKVAILFLSAISLTACGPTLKLEKISGKIYAVVNVSSVKDGENCKVIWSKGYKGYRITKYQMPFSITNLDNDGGFDIRIDLNTAKNTGIGADADASAEKGVAKYLLSTGADVEFVHYAATNCGTDSAVEATLAGNSLDTATPIPTATAAPTATPTPTPAVKKIFVTTSTYSPIFTTASAADAHCNGDAAKPSGGGTYKAMIDGGGRTACTFGDCVVSGIGEHVDWVLIPNTPYYRADETTLIGTTNSVGLFTFPLTNAFTTSAVLAITGLNTDWTTNNSCSNWINPGGQYIAGTANLTTDASISNGTPASCGTSNRFICVEQ